MLIDEGFNITSMYDPQHLEKDSQDEIMKAVAKLWAKPN